MWTGWLAGSIVRLAGVTLVCELVGSCTGSSLAQQLIGWMIRRSGGLLLDCLAQCGGRPLVRLLDGLTRCV